MYFAAVHESAFGQSRLIDTTFISPLSERSGQTPSCGFDRPRSRWTQSGHEPGRNAAVRQSPGCSCSNAQHDQPNNYNIGQQHYEGHRIVFEPIPRIGTHDMHPCGKRLRFCIWYYLGISDPNVMTITEYRFA